MEIKEYQEKSVRTLNNKLNQEQLIGNMALGMICEAGEVGDELKKHLYQGHKLNKERIKEELGDTMFYMVNLCNVLELDMNDILEMNYNKLAKRYPDGFEVERSINRIEDFRVGDKVVFNGFSLEDINNGDTIDGVTKGDVGVIVNVSGVDPEFPLLININDIEDTFRLSEVSKL